jgi:hypothetical protein
MYILGHATMAAMSTPEPAQDRVAPATVRGPRPLAVALFAFWTSRPHARVLRWATVAIVLAVVGAVLAFFAGQSQTTVVDFLYFSYASLTTVGYGDLSPAEDLGRMLAVSEALLGQLYLVTVVALLVGNIGRDRTRR